MTGRVRWTFVALAVIAFGVGSQLSKGPDNHVLRGTIGNISAPWLLVAALPAVLVRSRRAGAAVGLAATCLALLAFYVSLAHTVDPATVGTVLAHNRHWIEAGLVTGPAFGVVGSALRLRGAGLLAAALLVAEPAALFVGEHLPAVDAHIYWEVRPDAYLSELVLGLVVGFTARRLRRDRSADPVARTTGSAD